MKTYTAASPNVEVNGETVYAIVDAMDAFKSRALAILTENNISNPKAGQWYKQQDWLNAFKNISEKLGKATLFAIGQKIPENAQFPPEINDVHKALSAIDVAYHMNHRNGFIGNYKYSQTGERTGRMVCDNPYPDEFDRGIIIAMVRKFSKQNSMVTVTVDPNAPVREKGGDSTTYDIKW